MGSALLKGALGAFSVGLLTLCAAATAQTPTKIGVIVPRSWPSPQQGEEIILGLQLAIQVFPGRLAPELIIKDSACDAGRAEQAALELIAAKVDIVVGSWCVIGQVPKLVAAAGLPYVSAHAERIGNPAPKMLQLGRMVVLSTEAVAPDLREALGLRIAARTSCWMNFEPTFLDRYDGLLCPVLGVDAARWKLAEATYTAANRKPFTTSAARGYAAMEAALPHLRRLRAGNKAGSEPLMTIFGPVPAPDAPPMPDAMQLIFSPRMPKLSAAQNTTMKQLEQAKGCACVQSSACAKDSKWAPMPFVLRGRSPQCPALPTGVPL